MTESKLTIETLPTKRGGFTAKVFNAMGQCVYRTYARRPHARDATTEAYNWTIQQPHDEIAVLPHRRAYVYKTPTKEVEAMNPTEPDELTATIKVDRNRQGYTASVTNRFGQRIYTSPQRTTWQAAADNAQDWAVKQKHDRVIMPAEAPTDAEPGPAAAVGPGKAPPPISSDQPTPDDAWDSTVSKWDHSEPKPTAPADLENPRQKMNKK